MNRFVLDTDILSLLQDGHPAVVHRAGLVPQAQIMISVISVEEQLTGWYTRLRRPLKRDELAKAYAALSRTVTYLGQLPILSFSESAIDRFEALKAMRLNVATKDLRIAAIALEHNATVVTRNLRDFQRVPNLRVENWAA